LVKGNRYRGKRGGKKKKGSVSILRERGSLIFRALNQRLVKERGWVSNKIEQKMHESGE